MQIEVKITDHASPELQAHIALLERRAPLHAAMGKSVEVELRKRFARLNQTAANKRGWPRSNFWNRRVRMQTGFQGADEQGATVVIASREFLHKLHGGTIRPGPGKRAIAIPLRAEAAGQMPSARLIPGVFLLRSRTGRGAFLAVRQGKGKGAPLRLLWKLVPSVTHQPELQAAQSLDGLEDVALKRAERFLDRQDGGGAAAAPATGGEA